MEPVGSIVGAIFKLIKEITKTAKTARLNRTRCRDLAQRMEDVGNVLRASKAGAKGDAAAAAKRSILCRLKEALGNAVKLVESCSKKGSLVSRLHRFLASGAIAARFDDVHTKISNCLLDLSAASGVIIESKVDWLAARDRTTDKSKKKKNKINAGNAADGSKNGGRNKVGQNGGNGGKRSRWKKVSRPPPPPSHAGVPSYPNGHGSAYACHHHSIEEDPTSCSVM